MSELVQFVVLQRSEKWVVKSRELERAFGDRRKAQLMGQRQDEAHELAAAALGVETADQAAIDLHEVGGEEVDRALALGLYISASGVITYKKSEDLRAIFATVPLDRLLVETDAPYLGPIPHRGKRNEPAFVVHTAAAQDRTGVDAHAGIEALETVLLLHQAALSFELWTGRPAPLEVMSAAALAASAGRG